MKVAKNFFLNNGRKSEKNVAPPIKRARQVRKTNFARTNATNTTPSKVGGMVEVQEYE